MSFGETVMEFPIGLLPAQGRPSDFSYHAEIVSRYVSSVLGWP